MADRNQNAAEPHAVIITPVSMNDLIGHTMMVQGRSQIYCKSELSHDRGGLDVPPTLLAIAPTR